MQAEWGIPWDHIYETWTYAQFCAFAEALTERLKERADAQRGKSGRPESMAEQARKQTRWR